MKGLRVAYSPTLGYAKVDPEVARLVEAAVRVLEALGAHVEQADPGFASPRDAFWVFLDNRGWLHPFDVRGRRRSYEDVPKRITGLVDDPFRSLAGELRQSGGFAKDTTPFSEFLWADFLRRRFKRKLLDENFPDALVRALKLAKSGEADYLPGWCGPSSDQ